MTEAATRRRAWRGSPTAARPTFEEGAALTARRYAREARLKALGIGAIVAGHGPACCSCWSRS